jgi:hypothetical protein
LALLFYFFEYGQPFARFRKNLKFRSPRSKRRFFHRLTPFFRPMKIKLLKMIFLHLVRTSVWTIRAAAMIGAGKR